MAEFDQNKLKKNADTAAISNLLTHAKAKKAAVLVWQLFGETKMTCEMKFEHVVKQKDEITLRFPPEMNEKIMRIISGSECVNVFLPSEMALFRAKIKAIEEQERLVLHFPTMIAEVERRKHLRFFPENIGLKTSISFDLNGKKFDKDIYDIGSGGVSFMISKAESKFLNKNDLVENVRLKLDRDVFFPVMRVVNVICILPNEKNELMYKSWKICMKIERMPQDQQLHLEQLLFQRWNFDASILNP